MFEEKIVYERVKERKDKLEKEEYKGNNIKE